jgi:hypothetical protein
MRSLYLNATLNQQSAKTIARLEKERNARVLAKKLQQNSVQTTYLQKKISDIKTLLGNQTTIN